MKWIILLWIKWKPMKWLKLNNFISLDLHLFIYYLEPKSANQICKNDTDKGTRGVFRNLSRGGLKFFIFPGGLSVRWGLKLPKINRFLWSWGGLAPIAPPEYAPGGNHCKSLLQLFWLSSQLEQLKRAQKLITRRKLKFL